jgi:hypothetical protein
LRVCSGWHWTSRCRTPGAAAAQPGDSGAAGAQRDGLNAACGALRQPLPGPRPHEKGCPRAAFLRGCGTVIRPARSRSHCPAAGWPGSCR